MVSIDIKQERHNLFIAIVMVIIATMFILYMGSSLVHDTRNFWDTYTIDQLLE